MPPAAPSLRIPAGPDRPHETASVISTRLSLASLALVLVAPTSHGALVYPQESVQEPRWFDTLEAARAALRAGDHGLLLYFYLEDSDYCRQLEAESLESEAGRAELQHFACVRLRADLQGTRPLLERFGISKLPTLLITDRGGRADDILEGYVPLERFVSESARIRRGEDTVSDWRRRAEAAPDDLAIRMRLAIRLETVGDDAESQRLLDSIVAADPEGETVPGAQVQLYAAFDRVRQSASDLNDFSTWQLDSLYEHMAKVKPGPVLYEGWKWITDVELQRGDRVRERHALALAWTHAPEGDNRRDAGFALLQRYFAMEVELDDDDRARMHEVVERFATNVGSGPGQIQPAWLHAARAVALAAHGQHAQALAEAEQAVALQPEDRDLVNVRDVLRLRVP